MKNKKLIIISLCGILGLSLHTLHAERNFISVSALNDSIEASCDDTDQKFLNAANIDELRKLLEQDFDNITEAKTSKWLTKSKTLLKENKADKSLKYLHIVANVGYLYNGKGMFQEALELIDDAYEGMKKIDEAKSSKEVKYEIALALNYSGDSYYGIPQYNKAIHRYLSSVEYLEAAGTKESLRLLADTYARVALIHGKNNNEAEMKKYYKMREKVNKKIDKKFK